MRRGVNNFKNYNHVESIDDFLKIPPNDINKHIYYKDEKIPMPPIWFAIKYSRRDILGALLKKQKQGDGPVDPAVIAGQTNYAYSLALEAFKKRDFHTFANHFRALTTLDESKVNSRVLMEELDVYLAALPKKELKLVTRELLKSIKDITEPHRLEILQHSKFINYLTTAYDGSRSKATKEFNPDQMKVLNKVGFNYAKNKKNDNGDTVARYFLKQILKQNQPLQPGMKQDILFYQHLYTDNLDYALQLINKKTGSELTVDTLGVCSAFTKIWLFNEVLDTAKPQGNAQARLFKNIMEVASLTKEQIRKRVATDDNFVTTLTSDARNLDAIHRTRQFKGQVSQRTMKKQFGLELIDEYNINDIDIDKPKLAYLRVQYKDGDSGHAIGVHIFQKEIAPDQSVMVYKVWDPEDKPKTFTSRAKFEEYLHSLKVDPKIQELSLYEFSHFDEPATLAKITAINEFIDATSKFNYPKNSQEAAIINTILLLKTHYDNGVVPLNALITLFSYFGNILNNFGQGVDLSTLNHLIAEQSLISPKGLNLNRLPFLSFVVNSALDEAPPLPQVVTILFGLGLSVEDHFHRQPVLDQDMILAQAISENNRPVVNSLLETCLRYTKDYPVSLALDEMIKHPDNKECPHILARLFLKGKQLTEEDYAKLERRPKTTALFNQANPPYKETIKNIILGRVMDEIAGYKNTALGNQDRRLLDMLDYALNPTYQDKNGCYDMLTIGAVGGKNTFPRELIKKALADNNITVHPSMEKEYKFVFEYLKPVQVVSVHTQPQA